MQAVRALPVSHLHRARPLIVINATTPWPRRAPPRAPLWSAANTPIPHAARGPPPATQPRRAATRAWQTGGPGCVADAGTLATAAEQAGWQGGDGGGGGKSTVGRPPVAGV